jgi:epoxyqueuosine reductase QueG
MNTVTSTGMLPFDAVEDMNKIIDLSANIPEKLKPVLKKNATNDILTTEIQTNIRNNDNNEIIRDKLKSYKKYIDPQKYKTLFPYH